VIPRSKQRGKKLVMICHEFSVVAVMGGLNLRPILLTFPCGVEINIIDQIFLTVMRPHFTMDTKMSHLLCLLIL
jgi:hypothetical protein